MLLTSAQSNTLQSATADVVAQPVGARMVLPTNTARSLPEGTEHDCSVPSPAYE
jgi:hypothetical protein